MGTLPSHHRKLGTWSKPAATFLPHSNFAQRAFFTYHGVRRTPFTFSARSEPVYTTRRDHFSSFPIPFFRVTPLPTHRVDSKPRSTEDAPLAWVQRVPSTSPTSSEFTLLHRTGKAFLPSPHLLSRHGHLLHRLLTYLADPSRCTPDTFTRLSIPRVTTSPKRDSTWTCYPSRFLQSVRANGPRGRPHWQAVCRVHQTLGTLGIPTRDSQHPFSSPPS